MISNIQVKDLGKRFETENGVTNAFQNINFNIPQGQFCALIGPSGCGKTSLLRVLAGLETATSGRFELPVNRHGELCQLSMVFQQEDLLPWMSLKRNISFFLENNPTFAQRDVNAISQAFVEKVGLSRFADHYPSQVSGGMKQRLSLARSFASEPDLLLMDEPFVFLDYQSRLVLHELLLEIWGASKNTVLFVTHDIEEAVFLADRILVMSAHPGQVIQDVEIDFERPRTLEQLRQDSQYIETVNQLTQWVREEMKQQFA